MDHKSNCKPKVIKFLEQNKKKNFVTLRKYFMNTIS